MAQRAYIITRSFIRGRQEGHREDTGGQEQWFGDAGSEHEPGDAGGF